MLTIIDDDEWFELSLELSSALAELPEGSRLIESIEIPPFRSAIRASGSEMPSVCTVRRSPGIQGHQATASEAMRLATESVGPRPTPATRPADPVQLTIAVTQSDDGDVIAVAVAGLSGERCSFSTFEVRPGSHTIDLGFEVLRLLKGWAIRSAPASVSYAGEFGAA